MFRVGKKAQITLFIIVGLIFLVAGTSFLIFRESELRDSFIQGEEGIVQERVGSDFQPIQDFMITCVDTVTRDALERLGRHGGYVDPANLRANRVNPTSPNSNAIHFWPREENYKIAYWWHLVSSDDCYITDSCQFSTNRPPLDDGSQDSVDKQIERFVDDNIEVCIADFQGFTPQGFDFDIRGEPETEVIIAENDLVVTTDYPFEVTLDGRSQVMETFSSRLDVDLRNMWDIASSIISIQQERAIMETVVLELISLYSGTGPDALLPPSSNALASNMQDRRSSWTRTEVKRSLTSILSSYIPMFSVLESSNFDYVASGTASPYDAAIFDRMIMSVGDTIDADDIYRYMVDFNYKGWWDPYLRIGDSEIVEPDEFNLPFEIPGISNLLSQGIPVTYQFTYDLSFPVLMSLRDQYAFGGDGFTMNLAMETNLRGNRPVRSGDGEFNISAGVSPFSTSRLCRDSNLDTEDVKIFVRDSVTGSAIEGASIEYTCASDSCLLGNTMDQGDGIYFEGRFPSCIGGLLNIHAQDYGPKTTDLSIESGGNIPTLTYELDPVKEIEAKVKVFANMKHGGSWVQSYPQNIMELRDAESVLLTVEKVSGGGTDQFSSVAYFEGSDSSAEISLVPGEYRVSAQLSLDTTHDDVDPVVIPEDEIEEGGFLGIGSTTVTLDEIVFDDMFPQGSLMIDEDHGGNWIVTNEDLNEGVVTFYVVASPYIPDGGVNLDHDDLREFGKSGFYFREWRDRIKPCFGDFCE